MHERDGEDNRLTGLSHPSVTLSAAMVPKESYLFTGVHRCVRARAIGQATLDKVLNEHECQKKGTKTRLQDNEFG